MSADSNEKTAQNQNPQAEDRGARWAKYGSNVALTIVIVIVLAGLVTYIAQAHSLRVDTTSQGVNSLRPQTMNVLHGLNTDITLVSLYSKAKAPQGSGPDSARPLDKAAMVADLLDSYKRGSSHISVEIVDPADSSKLLALENQLDERYGKGISDYKEYLAHSDSDIKHLMSLITAQLDQIGTVTLNDQADERAAGIQGELKVMQKALENSQAEVRKDLADHRPDYRGIAANLKTSFDAVSTRAKRIFDFAQKLKGDPQLSQPLREYVTKNPPKLEEIQKIAEDQAARIDKLPMLKVDELLQALSVPNPILVLGPSEWRVLSVEQVWPANKTAQSPAGVKLQPSFAGEQQVTAAIIGLTSPTKPRVAILRPGGGPLASPGFPPFQPGGPFSEIADRLRMYNFDVVEKDMSGQYAMQAQMHGEQPAPEPSWQDIQDAVWLVLDVGQLQGQEPVAQQFLAHLGHGGSAVILSLPSQGAPQVGADPFQPALKEWGIDLRNDLLAVHEPLPPPPSANTDPLQDFIRRPFVWQLRNYGDTELSRPVKNLDSLMPVLCPVTTREVSGYTVEKLLPLPDAPAAPKSWGMKNYQELLTGAATAPPKFDPVKDLPGPLWGGATSEKKGGGRVVVIGDIYFLMNQFMDYPDEALEREEDRQVDRFPGNGELAMNSIFWAAKMDQMLALSPAALQVSRIGNMGQGTLNFWRIGLVLILLPGVVLVSGLGMYFARKD